MSARVLFIHRCRQLLQQEVISLLDVMAIEEECLELDEARQLDNICERYHRLVLLRFRRLSPFAESTTEFRRRLAFLSHSSIARSDTQVDAKPSSYRPRLRLVVFNEVKEATAAYQACSLPVGYKV